MSARPRNSAAAQTAEYASLQEAAQWFAELRSSDVSEQDRRRWQAWLEAAPSHRAAWARIEAVNQEFGSLPGEPARESLDSGRWPRRRATGKLLLLCLGVGLGGALLGRRQGADYLAVANAAYRTGVGATRQVKLADGTLLWLNTDSAVDIDYSSRLRRIRLHRGEILIESGADTGRPARPLVAELRDGRLRALGTRFSVRAGDDASAVSVYEGAVELETAHGEARQRVPTGKQLRFGADWNGAPFPADDNQAAWSENRLVASKMRLDDFLAELGRYRGGHLGCAPEVAHLRLTGSYPLADTDRILTAIESTLPVRVRRILPWWVTLDAL